MEGYRLGRLLGEGRYGQVFEATCRRSGAAVALKLVPLPYASADHGHRSPSASSLSSSPASRELFALSHVHHPHVCPLLSHFLCPPHLALVLPLLSVDLSTVLSTCALHAHPLSPPRVRVLLHHLLLALDHLHSLPCPLLHRDVKPSNLLLSPHPPHPLILCDLGSSRTLPPSSIPSPPLSPPLSTAWYRAPELLLSSLSYTSAVDVWAAGCVLAEMLAGEVVMGGAGGGGDVGVLGRVVKVVGGVEQAEWEEAARGELPDWGKVDVQGGEGDGGGGREGEEWDEVEGVDGPLLVDLLRRLLRWSGAQRLSAREALEHPYFTPLQQAEEACMGDLLTWVNAKRAEKVLTTVEVLQRPFNVQDAFS